MSAYRHVGAIHATDLRCFDEIHALIYFFIYFFTLIFGVVLNSDLIGLKILVTIDHRHIV